MTNFTPNTTDNSSLAAFSLNARKTLFNISFLIITLFCGKVVNAQTTHIGPANGGNFETGVPATAPTSFTNNNWGVDSQTNGRSSWTINTGANLNATNSAYIATAWNAVTPTVPPHVYIVTGPLAAYKCHFFKAFTVPVAESIISLKFDWLANGEAVNDVLKVWLMPDSVAATGANVSVVASGVVPSGIMLLGTYSGTTAWTTTNITIDPLYANNTAYRLVFEWTTNGTVGTQYPAAVDNVVLTSNPPVANDNCAGAIALTVNPTLTCTTTTAGTSINSSQSQAATCGGTFADDDVWYQFTATKTAHTITVTPAGATPMVDAVFEVFSRTGACTGLVSLGCTNSTTAAAAETANLTGLTAGNVYYVRVHSAANYTGQGTFTVCASTTPCVAPASQASGFTPGSITTTSYPATFTGTADGFLVIQSTSVTPPSQPVNGTLYTTSASLSGLGAGLTFVQSSASTSITSTGLTGNTRYYYYIYAYNNGAACGGPIYTTGGALTANAATCSDVPTSVAAGSINNSGFTLGWVAPVGGSASVVTYTVYVFSDAGYSINVGASPYTGIVGLSQVVTGLSASTLYYYRIIANNGCSSANVDGTVTTSSGIGCGGAATLACGTTNLAGTTVGSTSYVHGTGCTMSNYGKWYTFVGDGTLNTISSTATGGFDQEMAITSGTCGTLTNITCQDVNFGNGTETYTFTPTLGVTYYVYIAYWYSAGTNTDTGTFTISRTCGVVNPCTLATTLPCGTTNLAGTTVGSSSYTNGTLCSVSDYGKWYTFLGDGQLTTISATGNAFNLGMSIASGSCGSLTTLACQDNVGPNGTESFAFVATTGVTYYVYISFHNATATTGTFTISRTCATAFDACATILPLSCSTTTNKVFASGDGAYNPPVGDCGWYTPGKEQIYTFTPTVTGNYSISQTSSFTEISYFYKTVASGCNGTGWTCILNLNGAVNSGNFTLTAGVAYYILLDPETTAGGAVNFLINCPCSPGNGIGNTSLGCPNVISGGLGLNGAPHPVIDCKSPTCVDLEATYLNLGQTTNYTVTSITDPAPYQFDCLANPVSVNIDDVWSAPVTLPFNFCFYGNSYSSCIIGSNGILSFNTANAGLASGYEFNNNLPSTAAGLFANSIYGVYHDIDPSVGGEVGYELITLNTGCRALVASWSNVPMFNNNSIKYTGMMVLYENTNVIEVYIKEKKIDSYSSLYGGPWNYGNAIVGIENAAGTAAVVAPGRNGLSADWTATNEAWRFTPSGTSITTLKWYEGAGTTGPLLGTTNVINVCPTATTTYTAEVTYTLCNASTVKKTAQTTVTLTGSKIWNGSVDTDWNKPANWTPNTAIPNGSDCVIIPNTINKPLVSGTSYVGLAGTLTVYNNALLTVDPSNTITVTDWVNVNTGGTFLLNNTASLVQINNVANTGDIVYKRDTLIRSLDYVYWSSPVNNYTVNNIPWPSPLAFSAIYKWNTIVPNSNNGQGNWENASGNAMIKGKGYIARAPNSFTATPATFNGIFTGVPNNGDITTSIERGDITVTGAPTYSYPATGALGYAGTNGKTITNLSDNWNLVGNPYPSAIRASQFLFDNKTKILGNVRLWTHGNQPLFTTSPFYDTFALNYTANDYIPFNFSGMSCCPAAAADLFIGAGQAFFVQMIDGAKATDNITFNNNLRNDTYSNTLFYKPSNSTTHTNSESNIDIASLERNRIWLDLIDSSNKTNRTLFGYIENATMENDHFFDCMTNVNGEMQIYSLIDNSKFTIQGRSLPFDAYDEVPIGIDVHVAGNHSIAIAAVDGLFNTQAIYLKDTVLNITHDLKATPYQFSAEVGVINDRFKVVYVTSTLANPSFTLDNNVKAIVNNDVVAVTSNNLVMESVVVYNVLGQKLNTYNNINANYITLPGLHKNNTTLLLKIKLQTGEIVTRKVNY